MAIKWKLGNSFKPKTVLSHIGKERSSPSKGQKAVFNGLSYFQYGPVLQSMLAFPVSARHIDHTALVSQALSHVQGELTPESFLAEINSQLKKEFSQKEKELFVLTSISLENSVSLGSCTVDGVKIKFSAKGFPRAFKGSREQIIGKHSTPATESPESFTRVIIPVKAKSSEVAYSTAIRALDIYRAIWCLHSNVRLEIIGQSWKPINRIRLGSIHTIHEKNGAAQHDFWFEPNNFYVQEYKPKHPENVKKNIRTIVRRLNGCSYREALYSALIQYVRALDESNPSSALLRLWSAVERLTSPGKGVNENVVRRCAFLRAEPDIAVQELEHLRICRNRFTHEGIESP